MPVKRYTLLFLLMSAIVITGCKRSFDKYSWAEKDDMEYPNRDAMIDDLMAHHKLKGLTRKQLTDLLGQPQQADSTGLYYDVKIKYGTDIDPVYNKDLMIELNKDSVVTGAVVNEWKKN